MSGNNSLNWRQLVTMRLRNSDESISKHDNAVR